MKGKKKVLVITYYWPPVGGGGVQRWLKTSKYLPENGWEPIIFTPGNGESFVSDDKALSPIHKEMQVVKLPIWEPLSLYKKLTGKNKGQSVMVGLPSGEKGLLAKLSVWVRGNLFIPDAKMFWIRPASKFLIRYLKDNPVDAIVSTGPPHTTHLIAKKVSKHHKIPWLADFRDPWTNIDFYHKLKLSKRADKRHKKLENQVLHNAQHVVTVSKSWANDFLKNNGVAPELITNGYDPEDFSKVGKLAIDKSFSITHAGSLNDDRNSLIFWEVLRELKEELDGFEKDVQVNIIGVIDHTALQDIKNNGLKNEVHILGTMSHEKAIEAMIRSTILFLPLNDVPNIDGVIPGKLYEYIGAKRPILCIGKKTGDCAKIIVETKSGVVVDFKEKALLKSTLVAYYKSYKENTLDVHSEAYQQYSRKLLSAKIAAALDRITS